MVYARERVKSLCTESFLAYLFIIIIPNEVRLEKELWGNSSALVLLVFGSSSLRVCGKSYSKATLLIYSRDVLSRFWVWLLEFKGVCWVGKINSKKRGVRGVRSKRKALNLYSPYPHSDVSGHLRRRYPTSTGGSWPDADNHLGCALAGTPS